MKQNENFISIILLLTLKLKVAQLELAKLPPWRKE
jgi:hypothetical protein